MIPCAVCGERATFHVTVLGAGQPTHEHFCESHAREHLFATPEESLPPFDAQSAIAADQLAWAAYLVRGLCGPQYVPALVKTMSERDVLLRCFAAIVLGAIGSEAKDAIPTLTERLRDEEEVVRAIAAWALKAIGTADETGPDTLPT